MHLLLTDRLTCPRCGPTFGLILLADRMADRRVRQGTLGCPNCRDSFRIHDGFADLRAPPREELPPGRAGTESPDDEAEDDVERITALLGIYRGPGTVVFSGRAARYARGVADKVEDLQAVAMDADSRRWADAPAVSRMVASPGLPFFSGVLRGAVVDGGLGRAAVFEGARVVAPRSRVVVLDAEDDVGDVLREAGLEVLASDSGTVVATRG